MSQTTDLTETKSTNATQREPQRTRLSPPVDVYENEQEILIIADMPGVKADQVDVNLDGRSLTVEAWQDTPGQEGIRAFEFARSFRVPDTIDREGVRAELDHGVLKLHLAKAEAAKPRRIQVTSSS